jgi:hypothetical protein
MNLSFSIVTLITQLHPFTSRYSIKAWNVLHSNLNILESEQGRTQKMWIWIGHNIFNFILLQKVACEPRSSVSIVCGYGLDDQAFKVWSPSEVKGFFLYLLCPDQLWGPLSLLYNGYGGPFPRAKTQPGCDANHSPPSSANVENK